MEDKILPVNKQMIEITKQLIERCYKYESQFFETTVDRNICEAELRDIYDTVDSVMSDLDLTEREEYEEEIENLEDRLSYAEGKVEELADKNCELCEENDKLWERLKEISKVVNDTWC
jgi:predicted transcriptional regulator